METTTTIRKGQAINFKFGAWLITEAQFVNPGKGAAFTRCKLRNLRTGQVVENTFKSGEAVELVNLQMQKCQFLYKDHEGYNFMNNDSFEQFSLSDEILGDDGKWLLENTELYAMYIEGAPVSVQLPPKMDFRVIESPPGLKGDTATGGTKDVKLENGVTIKAPLFIKEGDMVKVNTEDGSYVSKAN